MNDMSRSNQVTGILGKKVLLTFAAIFVTWLLFLRNAMVDGVSFGLWTDNEFMIGTILSSMSESLRAGAWPFKMETLLAGFPLYNLTQFSVFYPFYFAALPIFEGPIEVIESLHWLVLMHVLIFEVNMYIFIRAMGVSRLASITGAALVAFSANSFVYATWINITSPYAWLPMFLGGLLTIFEHPNSKIGLTYSLVGMVLLTLASPAQPLIHAVYLTFVFFIGYSIIRFRTKEKSTVINVASQIAVIAISAMFLTAPVLLPAVIEYKNMIRWVGSFPPVVGNAPIPFDVFTYDQLSISDLLGVFYKTKSAAVGSQFVGVVPFTLTVFAVSSEQRSWYISTLLFIAMYSLVSSAGSNLGFAHLNYLLPLLNKIREPSRFLVIFQICVGALAAIGIDELARLVMSGRVRKIVTVLGAVVLLSTLALNEMREVVESYSLQRSNLTLFILLSVFSVLLISVNLANKETLIRYLWCFSALIALAVQVDWKPGRISSADYLTKGALQLDLAIKRVAELDPKREFRVNFDGKIDKPMAGMLASYRNVRTFDSFICPAPLQQFLEIYYHGPIFPSNYYRVLGAKFLICKECSDASRVGYKYLETAGGYEIYQSEDVLPRSYIASKVDGRYLDLQGFMNLVEGASLSNKILYIESMAEVNLSNPSNLLNECFSFEDKRTPNYSRFIVQCDVPAVLVLNEFHDGAWRVDVDGKDRKGLKVNGSQVAAAFKRGSHVIEFTYAPKIFYVSLLLAFIGVAFVFSAYCGATNKIVIWALETIRNRGRLNNSHQIHD